MNSLKNLMLLVVLAAIGYGLFAALSQNNVDSEPPFSSPNGDMASAGASKTPGLPISGTPSQDAAVNVPGAADLAAPKLAPPPALALECAAAARNRFDPNDADRGRPCTDQPLAAAPDPNAGRLGAQFLAAAGCNVFRPLRCLR